MLKPWITHIANLLQWKSNKSNLTISFGNEFSVPNIIVFYTMTWFCFSSVSHVSYERCSIIWNQQILVLSLLNQKSRISIPLYHCFVMDISLIFLVASRFFYDFITWWGRDIVQYLSYTVVNPLKVNFVFGFNYLSFAEFNLHHRRKN